MSAWTLCSCLAPQIEAFINLRRLSGTDYHSQAQLLGYFDRFLVEQGIQQPRVTREICDRYQNSLSALAPRTQGNRFGVVHCLCEAPRRRHAKSTVLDADDCTVTWQIRRPSIGDTEDLPPAILSGSSESRRRDSADSWGLILARFDLSRTFCHDRAQACLKLSPKPCASFASTA